MPRGSDPEGTGVLGAAAAGHDTLVSCCHIDLPQTVLAKIETNWCHYPVHLAHGSSCKYIEQPLPWGELREWGWDQPCASLSPQTQTLPTDLLSCL
uniref:Uncharacterized protein n=1 Tax=Vombatus ursinus TaxID=29139 RepID=A0A4X2JSI3_VOMUR